MISGGVTQESHTEVDTKGTPKRGLLETVQYGNGWEFRKIKYLRCWTTLYKTRIKTNGQIQSMIDISANSMGGEAASHTNPKKGHYGKRKIKKCGPSEIHINKISKTCESHGPR